MPALVAPRVLLIRRRYLGDIVLLGSVLRNLRLHWPEAHLTVLTEHAYAGVLSLNPDVNGALTFPRSFGQWGAFLRQLRRAKFTHVLDFDNTDKTAFVTRFTSARVRATYDRELIRFRHPRLYTHAAKVTNAYYDAHHITETYLALPTAIGVPVQSRAVRLIPHQEDIAEVERFIYPGSRKLLIHPGSRSEHRVWPVERFAAVADRVQNELDVQVFLTAGPRERAWCDAIRKAAQSHVVLADSPKTIGGLAALLKQFDAFLCHDSGPMHVAAAVGTPVVALFGSQNSTIWRPLGENHTILQTPLPCACIGDSAPTPCVANDSYRSYCVRMLEPDEVYQAIAAKFS